MMVDVEENRAIILGCVGKTCVRILLSVPEYIRCVVTKGGHDITLMSQCSCRAFSVMCRIYCEDLEILSAGDSG
jgi:hypothetical protein